MPLFLFSRSEFFFSPYLGRVRWILIPAGRESELAAEDEHDPLVLWVNCRLGWLPGGIIHPSIIHTQNEGENSRLSRRSALATSRDGEFCCCLFPVAISIIKTGKKGERKKLLYKSTGGEDQRHWGVSKGNRKRGRGRGRRAAEEEKRRGGTTVVMVWRMRYTAGIRSIMGLQHAGRR